LAYLLFQGFTTDVTVPISALAKVVTETREDIDKSGVFGAIAGHVGDGNFHCVFPADESNEEEMKIIWDLSDRVVRFVHFSLVVLWKKTIIKLPLT
uniref:FAD-oxidase_C domain-containing protein n=1 Tax=Gongylonema pulchrum TaxID=637853 RepID=A0A183DQU1_9BILA